MGCLWLGPTIYREVWGFLGCGGCLQAGADIQHRVYRQIRSPTIN